MFSLYKNVVELGVPHKTENKIKTDLKDKPKTTILINWMTFPSSCIPNMLNK